MTLLQLLAMFSLVLNTKSDPSLFLFLFILFNCEIIATRSHCICVLTITEPIAFIVSGPFIINSFVYFSVRIRLKNGAWDRLDGPLPAPASHDEVGGLEFSASLIVPHFHRQ